MVLELEGAGVSELIQDSRIYSRECTVSSHDERIDDMKTMVIFNGPSSSLATPQRVTEFEWAT